MLVRENRCDYSVRETGPCKMQTIVESKATSDALHRQFSASDQTSV
jgi:hypothetical protein